MNLNSIATDRPSGPQPSPSSNGGGESFQLAYAKVFDGRNARVAPDTPQQAEPEPVRKDKTAYTVQAGETLSRIARSRLASMGVAAGAGALRQGIAQIAMANNIHNPDRIYAGQKLDLAALDSAFGRKQAATPAPLHETDSSSYGSERIVFPHEIASYAPSDQDDMMSAEDFHVAAGGPGQLSPATLAEIDSQIAPVPPMAPMAPSTARQIALYEQNAAVAPEKPAEPVRPLPDIVYKGVAGKVLDALPIESSTRVALQRANTVVSSAFTARSLGALTGLGGPLLTVAGLIWGIFSSRQIEAAPTGDARPVADTNPVIDANQTAPTKVAEALNQAYRP